MHHLWFPILIFAAVFQGLQVRCLLRQNMKLEEQNALLKIRNQKLRHTIISHLEIYRAINPIVPAVASLGG